MKDQNKTFFASDFHLGTDGRLSSLEREKVIVRWISSVQDQMDALYLMGDVFDYWFEYGEVIPKGFSRFIGKLAELRDAGIPVYFFTGNHDMWMFHYFEDEMGIPIYREPVTRNIYGKKYYLGHGDGLGPGDPGYKILKAVLANSFCQWAFARIHPNLGLKLMKYFSNSSREKHEETNHFLGLDKEWLIVFVEEHHQKNTTVDYYVFGHRHLPLIYNLSDQNSIYYNLGDWLYHQTFLEVAKDKVSLKSFEIDTTPIIITGKKEDNY